MNNPIVILARSVVGQIEHHAREIGHDETGGILVGPPPIGDCFLITDQVADEGAADRTVVTYQSDAEYLQRQLGSIRSRYPGRDYRGTWHKQPSSTTPSEQDRRQAIEILSDPSYKVGGRLIMPIIALGGLGKRANLECHLIHAGESDFITVPHTIKSDDDPEFQLLMVLFESADRPVPQAAVRADHQTLRLHQELASLEVAGYKPTPKKFDDDSVAIELPIDESSSLVAVLPEEYPQNPPRLLLVRQNLTVDVELQFPPWSSAYMISDLVRQYCGGTKKEPRAQRAWTGIVNIYSKITHVEGR